MRFNQRINLFIRKHTRTHKMSRTNPFLDITQRRAILRSSSDEEDTYVGAHVNTLGGVFAMSSVLEAAYANVAYRRTVFTTASMQIALMCISIHDKAILMETFADAAQTIFIVRGTGELISNAPGVGPSTEYLRSEDMVVVPASVPHRILNCSVIGTLFLYVIYSKPVHAIDLVQLSCTDLHRPFAPLSLNGDGDDDI